MRRYKLVVYQPPVGCCSEDHCVHVDTANEIKDDVGDKTRRDKHNLDHISNCDSICVG